MKKTRQSRTKLEVFSLTADEVIDRVPFLRGGAARFARLDAQQKLDALYGSRPLPEIGERRLITTVPDPPDRGQPFTIRIALEKKRKAELVRLDIGMPSGATRMVNLHPTAADRRRGYLSVTGLRSACAGLLYLAVRVYHSDGSTRSDARLLNVFSRNPDRLTLVPQWQWRYASKVPFGQITEGLFSSLFEMFLTLTHKGTGPITYRRYTVRYLDYTTSTVVQTDTGMLPKAIVLGPDSLDRLRFVLSVPPGAVTNLINLRHEVAVEVTCHSDDGVNVTDWQIFRRMGTIPIAVAVCISVPAANSYPWNLVLQAVGEASREWEAFGLTIDAQYYYAFESGDPNIPPSFAVLDLGWKGSNPTPANPANDLIWTEFYDLCRNASTPDQARIDAFVAWLSFQQGTAPVLFGVAGYSPVWGPYLKDSAPLSSGLLVTPNFSNTWQWGRNLAHEIGHYLGLHHVGIERNLMSPSGSTDDLQYWQWALAIKHPMVRFDPIRHVSFETVITATTKVLQGDRMKGDKMPASRRPKRGSTLVRARLALEETSSSCGASGESKSKRQSIDGKAERTVLLQMLREWDSPESAGLRAFAARVLGGVNERRAVRYLTQWAEDRDEYSDLRLECVRALFTMRVRVSIATLDRLAADEDQLLAIETIAAALASDHDDVSAWAARRLARMRNAALRRRVLHPRDGPRTPSPVTIAGRTPRR